MKTLENYSDLKTVIEFCKDNSIDFKEVIAEIQSENADFEVDNYRFISQAEIDSIQRGELKSDTYILGCFNADFLADIIEIPYKAIETLQKSRMLFRTRGNLRGLYRRNSIRVQPFGRLWSSLFRL